MTDQMPGDPLPDPTQLVIPEVTPEQPEAFRTLMALCGSLEKNLEYMEALEKKEAETKERIMRLSERLIPDLMNSLGMTELRMVGGKKIEIKTDTYASVPKARMPEVLAWLKSKGMEAVAREKLVVTQSEENEHMLVNAGVGFVREATIHPSTLKAFAKEQIEAMGDQFPRELFGVYEVTKAVTTTTG